MHLVFEDAVTTTDLSGHRRTAILAARNLGRPFSIVTDLANCETISTPVVEEVRETVAHLAPFGLEREFRVVSEDTPDAVVDTFAGVTSTAGIDVVTVSSMDAVTERIGDDSDQATC